VRVLPAPCYIFSDAHLGVAPAAVERDVLDFLRSLRHRAGSLVINGDLFDFWFEWDHVIPRRAFRVLAALADLRESGVRIVMTAGNHDCWGGDVLRRDVGVDYRVGAWTGTLAGWKALVEHGDGLREVEDRGYRRWRRVLRHPMSVRAFRLLHPDWGSALAHRTSGASRARHDADEGAGLRAVAASVLAANGGLQLVVYGHSHMAALERMPKGAVYANAGSWLTEPTYILVQPDHVSLRRWNGSPEGVELDRVERVPQEALP
jgi:UDP-2,3-diacylglucosamine hydrolase